MPDTKVAGLPQIDAIDASLDFLPIVDVSDPTMAVSGTTKKVTLNQILQSGNSVVIPSGSPTQPALSFSSDGNTGIYSPAGDQLAISAGGGGRVTVTGSGMSVNGTLSASGQITSTVATGTAPLSIASTTTVTNLNSDLLDGEHGSFYQNAGNLNAGTLLAARMPAFSGDASSAIGTTSLTLANSGVAAGTYKSVTVDAKGRVTAGTNPTTLSGYGITDALNTSSIPQTKSGTLTLAGLVVTDKPVIQNAQPGLILRETDQSGTTHKWIDVESGTLRILQTNDDYNDFENHFSLNSSGNLSILGTVTGTQLISTVATGTAPLSVTSTTAVTNLNADLLDGQHGSYYQNAANLNAGTILAARMPAFSGGDVSSTAGTTSLTLASSGVTAGTYRSVTVDVKGRVTAGTNPTTLAGYGITDALDTSATAQTKAGNLSITGNFSAPNGDVASSIRAAASDYAGVAFDGATSNSRVSVTLTNQAIGTGDFSTWLRFRVPAATSVNQGLIGLTSSSTSLNVANVFFAYITSGGTLHVQRYGATTSDYRIGYITSFATTYLGQIVDLVMTRSGSTLKVYVNGVDIAYQELTSGTVPSWADTVPSDYLWVGQSNNSTGILNSSVYRTVLFNRALPAADVGDLIEQGVSFADQWGTQTQLINPSTNNGGFETAGSGGTDELANWVEYNAGTSTITRDTTDYSPDLGSTASAKMNGTDATAVGSLYNNGISQFTSGKRYRIRAAHKRSAAATISWKTASGNVALTSFSVTTSWANYSGEFVMPANDFVKIDFGGASTLWVDNVIYERIGAIVDLDLTKGIGSVAYDRSTNNLDGTLSGGVSWSAPKTQPVVLEAGSASAPSLTIAGDTNTGFYSPAADTLAIATGGSDAIYIDSSRRVGIGVSSGLIGQLRVGGADSVYAFAVSGATKGIRFQTASDKVTITGVDNTLTVSFQPIAINGSVVELATSSTTRATIKSTGQINLTGLASDPTGAAGDLYYSTGNALKLYTTAWNTVIHSGNVSTYALPIGGGTLAGALTMGSGYQIRATDGTTSAPGISFSSDQNTGLMSAAEDTVAVVTGGSERARVDNNGNVVVGTGVLANNATNGFLYIPSCAGTPTGTPTAYSGRVPLVWDSTNDILYVRSGNSWKQAIPAV